MAAALRDDIVAGRYGPGDRLPTRREIEARFGVCGVTVTRALGDLQRLGFIETRARDGVLVVQRPPHLTRNALVFPVWIAPTDNPHAFLFYEALAAAAAQAGAGIEVFQSIGHDPEVCEYRRLQFDVEHRRLAGIVFASDLSPHTYPAWLVEAARCFPSVCIATKAAPGVSAVYPDLAAFLRRAIDLLAERGCRRLALLTMTEWPAPGIFARHCAKQGIETHDRWVQFARPDPRLGANHAMQLLLHGKGDETPDGLVVADDHLLPAVVAGIRATRRTIGRDLQVVALANFPAVQSADDAVIRLGFDAAEALRVCLARLDEQRRGGDAATMTWIAPRLGMEAGCPSRPVRRQTMARGDKAT